MPEPTAVLFDVDGTLVDSNYLHVHAWLRAFHAVDRPVDGWRVHRAIGMGSDKLLVRLLGHADAQQLGSRVKDLHSELYLRDSALLRPFPGARELIRTLAGRGARVVLATSAGPDELEILRKVLDVDDEVAAVIAGKDVEATKPDAEPVVVALDAAGAGSARSIFVGDAVWDVESARRAEVRTVGVLSGGTSAAELREAGAVAVYRDVAEILAQLDDSPLAPLLRD
ncbi:HAD family hydrolase [Amycolatopsis sp. NPDC050768]|uniref:HAD family hydrolase n=1 Tax=Amycolatopsis sp. NPDC050768 TaxID=3154839 RepID=UPI0033E212DD